MPIFTLASLIVNLIIDFSIFRKIKIAKHMQDPFCHLVVICQMIYPNYKPEKFYNIVNRSSAVRTLMGGGQSGNGDQGPIL